LPRGASAATLRALDKSLKRMKKRLAALALGLAVAVPAHALQALRLEPSERIAVDGNLDEPAWQRAQLLDRFWEIFPNAESEPRVRTEARYAYDDHNLYIAVKAFDP